MFKWIIANFELQSRLFCTILIPHPSNLAYPSNTVVSRTLLLHGNRYWTACRGGFLLYTLKTLGSDLTRKRVPRGQTHSWVRLIWNPGKNYRNLSPKCLSDSDSGSVWPGFRVVWPGFRVGLTPKWVWPTRTLFRVKSDPGVFRV